MSSYPVLAAADSLWPFAVLGISVGISVLAITRFKLHPFFALICAAFIGLVQTLVFSKLIPHPFGGG